MSIYSFHVDVAAPPEAVADRVRSIVRQNLWDARDAQPFIGSVQDTTFKLRRNIDYRNSFLPSISGRIVSLPKGTRVTVAMSFHPAASIFMIFWLAFVGYGALRDKSAFPSVTWWMFGFGCVLPILGFLPEAIIARRLLLAAIRGC